jgi:putative hemolysin
MAHDVAYGVILALCLAVSFLLSGMEAGVFALNRLQIRQKKRTGDRRAKVLLDYLENPEDFLWTILLGNTLANFFAVCLVTAGLHLWLQDHSGWLMAAFLVFVFLLYAIGDLLPKMLFQAYPNRLALALARPFGLVRFALSPLVSLLAWFSQGILRWTGGQTFTGRMFGNREELRVVMQESAQAFTSEERSMINRVLDFQNLRVRQILVPLDKVAAVAIQTPMGKVLEICRELHLTRLLVEQVEDNHRRIVGLVSLKPALYRPHLDLQQPVRDFVKPAQFMADDLRLEEALRRLQRSGQRLAVVLDHNRCEIGVITLDDILKALFGEVSL